MPNRNKILGTLLKMERVKQDKGQKEICGGICVVSYLSKIEHGMVTADPEIISGLFARLGITVVFDAAKLAKYQKLVKLYYSNMEYGLNNEKIYGSLKEEGQGLAYSYYAIDWLLIQYVEGEGNAVLLTSLCDNMTPQQQAYFLMLNTEQYNTKDDQVQGFKEACQMLQNSYSYLTLCYGYFFQGNYQAIHGLENHIVTLALDEGNTYNLAQYYTLNGSAYACLNLEKLMMTYYMRSMKLLQNTNWTAELSDINYNIGATYISSKKYDLAIYYLMQVQLQDKSALNCLWKQKLALAYIRSGDFETGKKFIEEAKGCIPKIASDSEMVMLMIEEAEYECTPDYINDPNFLDVIERLIKVLKEEAHLGYLYFYKDVIVEVYVQHRKYKKALAFEQEMSASMLIN